MSLPSGHLPGSPNAVRKASPLAAISGVQAGCTARIDPSSSDTPYKHSLHDRWTVEDCIGHRSQVDPRVAKVGSELVLSGRALAATETAASVLGSRNRNMPSTLWSPAVVDRPCIASGSMVELVSTNRCNGLMLLGPGWK